MKRKILFGMLLAVMASLAVLGGVVLASGDVSFSNSFPYDFTHDYAIGSLYQYDSWKQYWDDGQGRYTEYAIQPGTYSYIYVAQNSPRTIFGIKAYLIRSDASQNNRNWADTFVDRGYYVYRYWPTSEDRFSKPSNPYNDPSSMQWEYLWQGMTPIYTGTDFWYAFQDYDYVYW